MTKVHSGLKALSKLALGGFIAAAMSVQASAADDGPIRIGVMAKFAQINGAAILNGATQAVEEINGAGGVKGRKIELIQYDDQGSASDATLAFQRAVRQDQVSAMVGTFLSEIAITLTPWAARLKVPYIVTGAGADQVGKLVHDNYPAYKYVFRTILPASSTADGVCQSVSDLAVKQLKYKRAVLMTEDAAWTKSYDEALKTCLPQHGLDVAETIKVATDTSDFTPIFQKIEAMKADVIVTGVGIIGNKPVVQWANQQVPMLLMGYNAQAGASSFWKETSGATQGLVTFTAASQDSALTPKTVPFGEAYLKRFSTTPAAHSYATYDAIYLLKNAIEKAGKTDADAIVTELEKADFVGASGRIVFQGPNDPLTHDMKFGKDFVTGVAIQWQDGKQVAVWPSDIAKNKIAFPAFVNSAPK
ncbi:branched-chain amino acid transport system substrate-binding protein [Neorhizobium sp. 2083]|uniref:ABC transporter substrate-binding protein n=1 Tax=Neorhizobium sp. 2083 TaxID=2817762 RepID=UPI00285C40D2|nr:ABC transporter substrate-binding protein [Neorhizobium sp. 2083]MDR6820915.1 branched-chain amino acid transport system substrate-binding protein [Neorhizobium sp. 2083]